MKGFKILKGVMISLALMFIIGAISTAASAATVITDKPDYAPGEVVIYYWLGLDAGRNGLDDLA